MLFSLAACAPQESTPALGVFQCVSAEYEGTVLDPTEIYDGGAVLELNENGQGKFCLADKSGVISWKLDGSELCLVFDDECYTAEFKDDSFTLELFDSGVLLTFSMHDAYAVEATGLQSAWNKSFYGWWKIGSASGEWQEYDGMWYDSFAVVQLDTDGKGDFIMWDEDSSYEEPICQIEVNAESVDMLNTVKGAFMDCAVDSSNWRFDTVSSGFTDMIVCELAYSDSKGAFNAVVYLRPWGIVWEDVEAEAPELLPYYYKDWYLPLVEAGSYMPMELEIN